LILQKKTFYQKCKKNNNSRSEAPTIINLTNMKNLLIVTGILLIILNTIIGLIVTKYSPFNYIMVDFSILISTILIYLFSNSIVSTGYKIGLTTMFFFTGLIKIILSIIAQPHFQDNIYLVTILGIITFEITCLLSAFAMKKFA
jgi:FtsH-binding integral membrane protein